ncbi:MAG: type II toxin-antitoxin system VapC family toxin [Nitrospira sp.]|nr:type II toxin-antitoxin system VapC family toxin [Nitrospira sp.]
MAERFLLDTHAILWALAAPEELRPEARILLADPTKILLVSPASIYEIALKVSIGKLEEPATDLLGRVRALGYVEQPITMSHALLAGRLPAHHRDPFDRLLIAQAMLEQLTLVTRDALFDAYGIPLIRC